YSPALLGELSDWQPDVVHTHGLWTHHSRSVHQWARRTGRPYVVSPHGMLEPVALSFSQRKKAVVRFLFQDAALRGAQVVHVTCESELESCRQFGLKQPITIVPNGVDVSLADLPAKKRGDGNRPAILSLGRIHPKKGLERLIRAWGLLEGRFPGWDLKIVGPGEAGYVEELRALAVTQCANNVQISGAVAGIEKTRVLQGAELFALPTLSENFALTVAESLVCETPVISTKGAPWAGLETHDCGWWIDHGEEAMAATLETAMSLSPEQRLDMGRRGRRWMEKEFSWDVISRQMANLYTWSVHGGEPPDHTHCDSAYRSEP
ncbi:MAG: glycosyltransferase, partial [Anderseniella sp.]|nr:glycosyltransferase [Anderseniella sp.]